MQHKYDTARGLPTPFIELSLKDLEPGPIVEHFFEVFTSMQAEGVIIRERVIKMM